MQSAPKSSIPSLILVLGSLFVLFFLVKGLLSSNVLPSLDEYMASSTIPVPAENIFGTTMASENAPVSASTTATTAISQMVQIETKKGTISAEMATSSEDQAKGLSDRASLGDDSGMLFVFKTPGQYSFWMKDMNFPLDIIWINSAKKVLGVNANVSQFSYPQLFISPAKVSYALELNAGDAKKFGIATGTVLKF
jgi:uncharacterized membrane protein (UPF0127 family)